MFVHGRYYWIYSKSTECRKSNCLSASTTPPSKAFGMCSVDGTIRAWLRAIELIVDFFDANSRQLSRKRRVRSTREWYGLRRAVADRRGYCTLLQRLKV